MNDTKESVVAKVARSIAKLSEQEVLDKQNRIKQLLAWGIE